jgi:hypothetical protein
MCSSHHHDNTHNYLEYVNNGFVQLRTEGSPTFLLLDDNASYHIVLSI